MTTLKFLQLKLICFILLSYFYVVSPSTDANNDDTAKTSAHSYEKYDSYHYIVGDEEYFIQIDKVIDSENVDVGTDNNYTDVISETVDEDGNDSSIDEETSEIDEWQSTNKEENVNTEDACDDDNSSEIDKDEDKGENEDENSNTGDDVCDDDDDDSENDKGEGENEVEKDDETDCEENENITYEDYSDYNDETQKHNMLYYIQKYKSIRNFRYEFCGYCSRLCV